MRACVYRSLARSFCILIALLAVCSVRRLAVIRCRSPTHVGQRGILIQETQETFVIVTERDAVKVLPKRHTVFSFSVTPLPKEDAAAVASSSSASSSSAAAVAPPQVFELFGDHLCFRSYERSARKFKAKATIML